VIDFAHKRIADPVHGTIGISDLETKLIDCRAFQRLRNVKQLGLAHLVFPGADYSRLAHSLGVCHVTGRLIAALRVHGLFSGLDAERETQKYRLAALCHDLGHYPFSHAMEEAVRDHYAAGYLKDGDADQDGALGHEEVSELVLSRDAEVRAVVAESGIDAREVAAVFTRRDPPPFANLVSSDLDADRIDYLLRTSRHTGLPYGHVDLDYLVSQMRLDSEGRLALTAKAIRAAEHLLLCRFFDYQTVALHKTVAAMELVLKDVLLELLSRGWIDCSTPAITAMVDNAKWVDFDDGFVLSQVQRLASESADSARLKAQSLLTRNVPKLLGEVEWFARRSDPDFESRLKAIGGQKAHWAASGGLPPELMCVWHQKFPLTKAGAVVPYEALDDVDEQEDNLDQSIRILARSGHESKAIFDWQRSLTSVLADKALYTIRVYALIPPDDAGARERLRSAITSSPLAEVLPWN
jgi:hypothetical protein